MTTRIFNAPPGLDYRPVRGAHADLSFGVVQSNQTDPALRLQAVIAKRLFPRRRPVSEIDWREATAEHWDVLLPKGAPNELWRIGQLCEAYHDKDEGLIADLAAIVTIRWPQVEALAPTLPMHEAWECSRTFAKTLVDRFSIASIAAFHVPARSWARGVPHVHLMFPCRTIRPGSGFADFCRPIANPCEGREIVDDAWSEHLAAFVQSQQE